MKCKFGLWAALALAGTVEALAQVPVSTPCSPEVSETSVRIRPAPLASSSMLAVLHGAARARVVDCVRWLASCMSFQDSVHVSFLRYGFTFSLF